MLLADALARTSLNRTTEFQSLNEILSPEIIQAALHSNQVVTLRRRKLPMDAMVWAVIGMALFRGESVHQLITKLDIMLPDDVGFVARSAVTQARQKLGSAVVQDVFRMTQQRWHQQAEHPHWCGLNLYGVDGVVWRTPDSDENSQVFARAANQHGEVAYPQVRMVCLMELSSHLLVDSVFDSASVGEVTLASQLSVNVPNQSLTLFDRGFYSLGLLHQWHLEGKERHWLLPLRKGAQFEVIKKFGRQDALVRLTLTPQSRKKNPTLPEQMEARLLTKTIKGKERQILTSLTDPMKYPASDIVDLYSHRWEIELGYREMKQYLLESRFTLRSQLPELVKQELWGILLAYNLLRYKMILMAKSLDGIYPCQLSFREASSYIIFKLCQLPMTAPGNIPAQVFEPEKQARQFVLEGLGRERCYPRVLKCSKNGYPVRKRNAAHLK